MGSYGDNRPRITTNKRAHFRCLLCVDAGQRDVWREGGIARAERHVYGEHGLLAGAEQGAEYEIDMRIPQVYLAKARSFSGMTNECKWGHRFMDRQASNGQCPECAEDDETMRKIREAVVL